MFHPQNTGWIPEREEELMGNADRKGVCVVSLRKYPNCIGGIGERWALHSKSKSQFLAEIDTARH